MTYAGRLDPMASGVLVVLAGEEAKNKEKYLAMGKEYDFSVLFGFSTDTHDILGKILKVADTDIKKEYLEHEIKKELGNFKGKLKQKYPAYSSKTVDGRPLFSYARNGEEVEIPEREIFIDRIRLEKIRKVTKNGLLKNIGVRIGKVNGDFRQAEILKLWQSSLSDKGASSSFYIADFKVKCSSGTYVRVIANSLGEKIKIPALAFSIKRTKVGKYIV